MGNLWSQPIRVECYDMAQLSTSRSINSVLWFVNNPALEERILAFVAKYQAKYGVIILAFGFSGSHYHIVALFPNGNRSAFFRDLNARIAEAVRILVDEFPGGPLFERRYTPQILPLAQDVEKYFYYTALQAVSDGLCEKISDYPGYNSFHDASLGIARNYKLFNYGAYNDALRKNRKVSKNDFYERYQLIFSRLPGYEDMPQAEYRKMLLARLEERRMELVRKRRAEGKGFLGKEKLKKVVPGTYARNPKRGTMRPLVLSSCPEAKKKVLHWYFSIVAVYKKACERYRNGEFSIEFPPGTYRPPGLCIFET